MEKLDIERCEEDKSESAALEDIELDELRDNVIWMSPRAREDMEYRRQLLIEVDDEVRPRPGVMVLSEQNVRAFCVMLFEDSGQWVGITPEGGLRISF